MLNKTDLIFPDWPAPANVKALQTTRVGGVSSAPYDSLNLGAHVGDDPLKVAANRQLLSSYVPTEPVWLNQGHGIRVIDAGATDCVPDADATYARVPRAVCVTMTADCLPVLLCDEAGSVVAAVHAGWKGLLDGVIEATVVAMQVPAKGLMAWLGPAIGPQAFEAGSDVRNAFIQHDAKAAEAFVQQTGDKWLGDIYLLARQRLHSQGVTQIYGGGLCTYFPRRRE